MKTQEKPKKIQNERTIATGNTDLVNALVNQPPSKSDPFGSYTGKPLNENEVPVQDADDL